MKALPHELKSSIKCFILNHLFMLIVCSSIIITSYHGKCFYIQPNWWTFSFRNWLNAIHTLTHTHLNPLNTWINQPNHLWFPTNDNFKWQQQNAPYLRFVNVYGFIDLINCEWGIDKKEPSRGKKKMMEKNANVC